MSLLQKTILFILALLTIIGLFTLYSALHQGGEMRMKEIFFRQIFWFSLSWGLLALCAFVIPHRHFYDLGWILYGITFALLVLIVFIGETRMGAQRWLSIGSFNLQPSELAKCTAIVMLARFFSRRASLPGQNFLSGFIHTVVVPFIPVAVLSMLIFIQPDLGSAVLLILLFLVMMLVCGVKKSFIATACAIGLFCLPIGWHFLKEYQRARLTVFLNPNVDPLGAGYTIIQSKIAIGSGQFWGKGFLAGTQNQLNFLPERHTDFIFTIVAEEWGFLGTMLMLLLYYFLIRALFKISCLAHDDFSKCLGAGVCGLFSVQVFVNLAMAMGFLPVVGIPLLFMSYGGTHLMVEFLLVGVVLNIARENKL